MHTLNSSSAGASSGTGSSLGGVPALRPGRVIEGISAVLLPFRADAPDWSTFTELLDRTWRAGLTPAVNMDTGYVNLLTTAERARVLAIAREVSASRRFVAGAFIEGEPGIPRQLYGRVIDEIRRAGGTPILFQCSPLASSTEDEVLAVYADLAAVGDPLLAFELGTMFAPFGRIYSTGFLERLMELDAFVGVKHSSLDRRLEWDRIASRDRLRPDFRIYTGNDLAIDMAFYGSDYLLGLSAFAVEAFAARDRCWAAQDPRAFAINDLLQYLGQIAFRAPVPAYKHSAAQFLHLRGIVPTSDPHPRSLRRPDADLPLLADIHTRLEAELQEVGA
ncbi:MAG: dihydrodipicolinate synthase family protein [Vicinamibacterales bacterium]